ncbi:hypothetical protein PTSG_09905 [Salpingoeca rosetta]|uniref:Uncharacterized protein n=1 Tax=Salpingoeca rosetta (strain ATCC 50818 / BSB-021) TaxID=946362 RepID=F2UNG8_SALR5|nr:uncharacterized protein PTSG_09905 [Salpingoeca rosetta]EGD79173.1 hypothetical protein PTSG_09905 [Salpingoeca rosetta]|eukprot:XP_004989258.1 hypothetical protein PTSG_09905 [Salpingoeca rosetta]
MLLVSRFMLLAVACLAAANKSLLLAVAANDVPYPYFASDSSGHLHINTTSPEQDVFVNGVSFKQLVEDVKELKAVVGLTDGAQDSRRGRITDVFEVYDDAVYISAPNGVFFSSSKEHKVTEAADGWNPVTVSALVGDYMTFKWSSLEAVYETMSDGSTAVQGGFSSGNAKIGGEFTIRLREAKTYYFRAANKGFVCTVVAKPAGVAPAVQQLQVGRANYNFEIVGFGEDAGSNCENLYGAMYNSNGACKCREGAVKRMYRSYDSDDIYMCVVAR